MGIDWRPWVDLVQGHDRFVLTSHVRPDGDSIGSAVALRTGLRQLGKHATIVNPTVAPPRYAFLDPHAEILAASDPLARTVMLDAEVIVIVDTSSWDQIGPVRPLIEMSRARRVVIDHHLSQDDLGAIMLKDTSVPACGILVLEALHSIGCTITQEIATALFAAIATDTGWFRFESTSAHVLRVAADLVDRGAQPDFIYRKIFEENSLARLHLMGRALVRLQLTPSHRVCYTYICRRDIEETGALQQDTEDVVNYTLTIAEAELGLLFIELGERRTKISFRSRGHVDCTAIAGHFGGGGHRHAAGAVVELPLEDAIRTAIEYVEAQFGGGHSETVTQGR